MIDGFSTYSGLRLVISPRLTKEVPRFPDKRWTKRRRRRVVGKYGSWTYHKPDAMIVGGSLLVHPAIYAELKRAYGINSARH